MFLSKDPKVTLVSILISAFQPLMSFTSLKPPKKANVCPDFFKQHKDAKYVNKLCFRHFAVASITQKNKTGNVSWFSLCDRPPIILLLVMKIRATGCTFLLPNGFFPAAALAGEQIKTDEEEPIW